MPFDSFLKLDNIKGESTDSKHKDEIEVLSFSFGVSNPTTIGSHTGGAGAGKVSFSSFNFMKPVDRSSPVLLQTCASGAHFQSAVFVVRKAGGTQLEYLKYKFSTVFVESVQWSGTHGPDDVPVESVSLVFGRAEVDYQPQGADGKAAGGAIHGGWDQIRNIKA
jgi:type VI secretion system secreted protein Hcp